MNKLNWCKISYSVARTSEGGWFSYWEPQKPRNHTWKVVTQSLSKFPVNHREKNIHGWSPPNPVRNSFIDFQVTCPSAISSATMSFPSTSTFFARRGSPSFLASKISGSTSASAARLGSACKETSMSVAWLRIVPSWPTDTMNPAIGVARARLWVCELFKTRFVINSNTHNQQNSPSCD